ncbi:hypothetical protein [Gorillibacterium massiliense]|uniref:hypothetical protein n=1 Tax=Gorillibacterium massiliense TaxID=1280390 RepID=UPI0012DEDE91|nr:hypothetical protein [Gorillibacterium massiliense]
MPAWLLPASFWVALVLSAAILLAFRRRQKNGVDHHGADEKMGRSPSAGSSRIPAIIVAAVSILLLLPPVISYLSNRASLFEADIYQGLFLSIVYLLLGIGLHRRYLALAIWMLLLTAVIGLFYSGFAPFAIGMLGGFSLLICGHLLKGELPR